MDEKDLMIQTLRRQNMELSAQIDAFRDKYAALLGEILAGPDEQQRKIKELENELSAQRELVPVLPGTTVYVLVERSRKQVVEPWYVKAVEIDEYGRSALKFGWYKERLEALSAGDLGHVWFRTREEAEEVCRKEL